MTPPLHRRDFLAQTTAATAAAALAANASAGAAPARSPKNNLPASATDKVTLGKTGVQVSLIGMGTGSVGSGQASNQTRLGAARTSPRSSATRIDHGVTFFDVADQYGSHVYLREAPARASPATGTRSRRRPTPPSSPDCKSHLERYRLELGVEYIDIVLLHCMTKAGWQHDHTGAMDYLRRAKEEKLIRAHGTSCHGAWTRSAREAAKEPFVEVDLARIQPPRG